MRGRGIVVVLSVIASLCAAQAAQVDITFDGQSQLRFFGSVVNRNFMTAILPSNAAAEQLRKSHLMVDQEVFRFALTATEELLPAIARCVEQSKAASVANLGNFNFASETGALRDVLDNSVVAYKTVDPGPELKTGDIANSARAFTMLISCTASGVD